MSKTNWTPGPWECGINPTGYFSNEVVIRPKGQFPHGDWIADCGPRADVERNANAHLIAASPEMYEMLLLCVKELNAWLECEGSDTATSMIIEKARLVMRDAEGVQ